MRRVLITGSAGHIGRALRATFTALGDHVVGVDLPGTGAEYQCDLDSDVPWDGLEGHADIVICNAKLKSWEAHHALALQARSVVINVASIYGLIASDPEMYVGTEVPHTPSQYVAAKGAIVALTRHQAALLGPKGVRVNCVAPGGIFRGHSAEFQERYCRKVPLGRMASESDIVRPIVWLCSDAAQYITGAIIPIDGGYTAL